MHPARLRSATWRSRSLPVNRRCSSPAAHGEHNITGEDRPNSAFSQSVSGTSDVPLTLNQSRRHSMVTDVTGTDNSRNDKDPSKTSKILNYLGIFLIIIGAIPLITGVSRHVSATESIIIGGAIIGLGVLLVFFVCWCTYVCQNVEDRIPMRHPKIIDGFRKASIASNQEAFRRAVVSSPKIVVEMVHEITDPLNSNFYNSNSIPNQIRDSNILSPKKSPRSPRKCSL